MCANKVKENEYNLTPLSIFIQKVQGVGNLTKNKQSRPDALGVGSRSGTHTLAYSFPWASLNPVLKYRLSGTRLKFSLQKKNPFIESSPQCFSAQLKFSILSPNPKNLELPGKLIKFQVGFLFCFVLNLKLGDKRSWSRTFFVYHRPVTEPASIAPSGNIGPRGSDPFLPPPNLPDSPPPTPALLSPHHPQISAHTEGLRKLGRRKNGGKSHGRHCFALG